MAAPTPGAPKVVAILFDLDDTLFDHTRATRMVLAGLYDRYDTFRKLPFEPFAQAHTRLLDELHVEVLAGRLSVDAARLERIRRLFALAGGEVPGGMAEEVAEQYRAAYVASWRPVAGALDLLARLRPHVRLGVVTNNVVAEQVRKVEACGLKPYLDALVISEAVGIAKPDPRIFQVALARLGSSPDETVMVGDSWPSDIVGASRAGLRVVWLNRTGAACPAPPVISAEITALEPADDIAARLLAAPVPESRVPDPESRAPNPGSRPPRPESPFHASKAGLPRPIPEP